MFLNSVKPTIVIAGAGFGGLRTALDLNRAFKKDPRLAKNFNLYLVDQNDHHLFTPSLYEMATTLYDDAETLELKKAITVPLEKIFKPGDPLRFCQARISRVDIATSRLILNDHTALQYDYLVVAVGAEVNFYDIHNLKDRASTLNNLNSAIRLRSAMEREFCRRLDNPKPTLRIVLGGAGVGGTELAGEICGYIKKLNQKYGAAIKTEITLIEGQPEILPGFHPQVKYWAKKRLGGLGVKIATDELISEVSGDRVITKTGKEFAFDILIWSGGIKTNSLLSDLPFKKDPRGRIITGADLRPLAEVDNPTAHSDVLVIGDNCCLKNAPLAQTAQMAIAEGQHAAKIILAKITNRPIPVYEGRPNYYVLPIGGKFAIADLISFRFKGFFAWALKELIFLEYLLSILSPAAALAYWFKAIRLFIKND